MERTEAAAPKKGSVWEDLVDIYFAPSEVFARRRDGQFGVALIVLILATAVLFALTKGYLQPIFDAQFQKGMESAMRQNPRITQEQMETMRSVGEKVTLIVVPITLAVSVFVIGLLLWLVGKAFGSTQPLGLAVMVATFSQYPRIIQAVLNGIQGFLMDPARLTSMYSISASPARFLDPTTTSPAVMAVLSRLDIFTLWCTVLLAIGLHVTGNISKGKAYAAAFIVWALAFVPALYQATKAA